MANYFGRMLDSVPLEPGDPQQSVGPPQQPVPPANEQELMQRTTMWDQFLQKLTDDKNFRDGILSFGTNLIQPRGPGQTQAGAFGQAVNVGRETYRRGATQDYQRSREGRLDALEERRVGAQEAQTASNIAGQEAQSESVRAATKRLNDMAPLEKQQLQQIVNQLKATNDPELLDLIKDKYFTGIELTGAQTALLLKQAELLPEEIAARYASSAQPASAVQELQVVANALRAEDPSLTPSQALLRAQDRQRGLEMKTPAEYAIEQQELLETMNIMAVDDTSRNRNNALIANNIAQYNALWLERQGTKSKAPESGLTPEQQAKLDQAVAEHRRRFGEPPTAEEMAQYRQMVMQSAQ